MAWESRIRNPLLRRVVLAGVMLGLLACSTTAALLLARRPLAVTWRSQQFGPLTVQRPAHWRLQQQADGSASDLVAVFDLPDLPQCPLKIFLLHHRQPLPPRISGQLLKRFMNNAGLTDEQTFRQGPLVGWWARGYHLLRLAGLRAATYYLLVDVTLDGSTHLLMFLAGPHQASASQLRTLLAMAGSLRDCRVSQAGPHLELGEARLDVPPGLVAFQSADQSFTGAYELLPDGTGPWRDTGLLRLSPRRIDLRDMLERAAEALDLDVQSLDRPDAFLDELLVGTYRQLHRRPPPPQALARFEHAGHPVHTILLSDPAGQNPLFRALWLVGGPSGLALKIDLVADPDDRDPAEQAARRLLEGLTWNPTPHRSP